MDEPATDLNASSDTPSDVTQQSDEATSHDAPGTGADESQHSDDSTLRQRHTNTNSDPDASASEGEGRVGRTDGHMTLAWWLDYFVRFLTVSGRFLWWAVRAGASITRDVISYLQTPPKPESESTETEHEANEADVTKKCEESGASDAEESVSRIKPLKR